MKLALVVCGIVALGAAAQAAEKSCTAEIGAAKALVLVDQCIAISTATHPPCNAEDSCSLIRDEVQRGCNAARQTPLEAGVPGYCADYPADPSDY